MTGWLRRLRRRQGPPPVHAAGSHPEAGRPATQQAPGGPIYPGRAMTPPAQPMVASVDIPAPTCVWTVEEHDGIRRGVRPRATGEKWTGIYQDDGLHLYFQDRYECYLVQFQPAVGQEGLTISRVVYDSGNPARDLLGRRPDTAAFWLEIILRTIVLGQNDDYTSGLNRQWSESKRLPPTW
jgi:hypothetical protein